MSAIDSELKTGQAGIAEPGQTLKWSALFGLILAPLRPRPSRKAQVRSRIEAYYRRGQDLYVRLANDSTIPTEDIRQLVANEWVNPVTEYLRGTLGERKSTFFLSIARGVEPDEESVARFGYSRALARERLMYRLERLRKIAGEV